MKRKRFGVEREVSTRSLTSVEITKIVAGMVSACVILGVPHADLRRLMAGLRIAGLVGSLLQWNSKLDVVESLEIMERSWKELFDEFTPHVPRERPRN